VKFGTKKIVFAGVATVALFALLGVLSGYLILRGFTPPEDGYARRNVERVLYAIEEREKNLATSVADWASWDALYSFVVERNQSFAEENLTQGAFVSLKIDLLFVADETGALVWGGLLDEQGKLTTAAPPKTAALFAKDSPLSKFDSSREQMTGLIEYGGKLTVIAARRILTSSNEGPSCGTLVMGRFLDAQEVRRMADTLRLQAVLEPADPSFSAGIVIQKTGRTQMIGRSVLRDIYGHIVSVVRVDMPRDIFEQGTQTAEIVGCVLVGVGFVFAVFIVFHMHAAVVTQMERVQFKAVLDEVGDAVIVCDGEWKVRDINCSALRLLQISDPSGFDILECLYGKFEPALERATLTDRDRAHLRFDVIRPQTTYTKELCLEASLDMIRGQDGLPCRRVLILRDVSEARFEERMKKGFFGLISHKLRTPVTVMMASLDLLTDVSVAGPLSEVQTSLVSAMCEYSGVLHSLIEKLLSFTETCGEHRPIRADRVDLLPYLRERAARFAENQRKNVQIEVVCPADGLSVLTSRTCFDLIVDNLIENAVKFGDKALTKVTLTAQRGREGVVIAIADNGPGFPPEDVVHVFSMFHQIEKGYTGQTEGVGLGLALVKRLVGVCAGSVEMCTVMGEGTTFTLQFPFS